MRSEQPQILQPIPTGERYNLRAMEATKRLDWKRLMEEALTAPGDLGQAYSRFHDYSITNMLFFRMQGITEPVASYQTWRSVGRQVMKGAKAKEVIVPRLIKEKPEEKPDPNETPDEKQTRVSRLVGFTVMRAIFTLSDTTGKDLTPAPIPGWELQAALDKLGVRQIAFTSTDGNLQGYSRGLEFAVNPVAINPRKTMFHELGHIVLSHTTSQRLAEYQTHRGIMEFEAEGAAYIAMNELGLLDEATATRSRGYIKHWLHDEQPPEQSIRQVFRAADAIIRAGRESPATPSPV